MTAATSYCKKVSFSSFSGGSSCGGREDGREDRRGTGLVAGKSLVWGASFMDGRQAGLTGRSAAGFAVLAVLAVLDSTWFFWLCLQLTAPPQTVFHLVWHKTRTTSGRVLFFFSRRKRRHRSREGGLVCLLPAGLS